MLYPVDMNSVNLVESGALKTELTCDPDTMRQQSVVEKLQVGIQFLRGVRPDSDTKRRLR